MPDTPKYRRIDLQVAKLRNITAREIVVVSESITPLSPQWERVHLFEGRDLSLIFGQIF